MSEPCRHYLMQVLTEKKIKGLCCFSFRWKVGLYFKKLVDKISIFPFDKNIYHKNEHSIVFSIGLFKKKGHTLDRCGFKYLTHNNLFNSDLINKHKCFFACSRMVCRAYSPVENEHADIRSLGFRETDGNFTSPT